jgi:hypothetical protein
LLKALRAKLSAKSYRFKSVQSDTSGQNFLVEAEYVAPDRYHMVADSNLAEKGRVPVEMVVLGQELYAKAPGKGWERKQLTLEEARREHVKEEMLIKNLAAADESAITYVGTETLEGAKYYIYQYSSNRTPDVPAEGQTKTWIGVADGLPYKVEIKSEIMAEGERLGITLTTTYRDYNTDIKVEAPIQ